MKTNRILSATGAFLSTALLLALAPAAQAAFTVPDLTYTVTLNLSQLSSDANAPFSLDLQLAQGSGNVTNTVTLSNFSITGGTFAGTPNFTYGDESGSLASTLTLTSVATGSPNSYSDNEFAEAFSAGTTQISFKVDETPNSEVVGTGTPIPDQFNVAIYDNTGNTVPTTDPSGANTLVSSALSSTASLSSVEFYSLEAEAPEPKPAALLLVGALGLLGLLRLRQHLVA